MPGFSLLRAFIVTTVVWFASPLLFAQVAPGEPEADPPLSVETVGLEPTAAKTGDVITAIFRVRFKELVDEGKEILVLEDRMAPEQLPLAPFEGLGLAVTKRRIGDEHVWDFAYSLRLIDPAKGIRDLRPVTVYWVMRDLGQPIEDARVLQSQTDPLPVRYVTTITDEVMLDVRDPIELGAFGRRSAMLRAVAWVVAPLPLAAWVVGFFLARRRPKPVAATRKLRDDADEPEATIPALPTVAQARRNVQRELKTLGGLAPSSNGQNLLDLERRLVVSLREYLAAELPRLNPGDTAKEIQRHVERMASNGNRKAALGALAGRLVALQNGLERGTRESAATDPAEDAREIAALLQRLRLPGRFLERMGKSVGRS